LAIIENSTPIRRMSPDYFRVHIEATCRAKIHMHGIFGFAALSDTFLFFLDIDDLGDIPKIPIYMIAVVSGEFHSNTRVLYVDCPLVAPRRRFCLGPRYYRNL
jgi:hypothetical protein